jgi:hypothetical protein
MCSKFLIFNRPILEEYVYQVEEGYFELHESMIKKGVYPSFENLAIIGASSVQTSLMNIHHNTSYKFILEDNSISSAFKAYIRSCLGRGAGLWLIIRPLSIHSTLHALLPPQHCVFVSV